MDVSQLSDFKQKAFHLLAQGEVQDTIALLVQSLPVGTDKYIEVINISFRLNEIKGYELKQTQHFDTLQIEKNRINESIIKVVNALTLNDFNAQIDSAAAPSSAPQQKRKVGSILYTIPSQMELHVEKECIVRIAMDENLLLENLWKGESTHIKELRKVSNRMAVRLVSVIEGEAFTIREVSPETQIIDEDDYTQWSFFIKPVKEGRFSLRLQVFVVVLIDGEKERKELSFDEIVEVVTHEVAASEGQIMKQSGFLFCLAAPSVAAAEDSGNKGQENANNAAPTAKPTQITLSKIGAAAGVVGVTLGMLWYLRQPPAGNTGNAVDQTALSENKVIDLEVNAPLFSLQKPAFPAFTIRDHHTAHTFQLPGGSSIDVPANAFSDSNGQAVHAEVVLEVREYRKADELLLSGIPMRFTDNTGKEQWMQSYGMFEINAYEKESRNAVEIIPGKYVDLHFATSSTQACALWRLDTNRERWTVIDTVQPQLSPHTAKEEQNPDKANFRKAPVPTLVKPGRINKSEPILDFKNIDYKALPELQGIGAVLWQYAGDDPANNPIPQLKKEKNWDYVKPEPLDNRRVRLTLTKSGKSEVIVVRPCVPDALYDDAIKHFNETAASIQRRSKLLEEKAKSEEIDRQQSEFSFQMRLNRTGIYNYDYLLKRDDAVPLLADFDFGDSTLTGKNKEQIVVYLITGDKKTVVYFRSSDWSNYSYIPTMDNMLIALLPGNRVAVFDNDDFVRAKSNIRQQSGQYFKFNMKILPEKLKKTEDLQKIIG